jgi:hypothetical protein
MYESVVSINPSNDVTITLVLPIPIPVNTPFDDMLPTLESIYLVGVWLYSTQKY